MIRFILFVLFLSACAAPVAVTPRGCETEAVWGASIKDSDFSFEMHVWGEEIHWERLLVKKGIFCPFLRSVSISLKRTTGDFFLNLLPGVTSTHVKIVGKLKSKELLPSGLPPPVSTR